MFPISELTAAVGPECFPGQAPIRHPQLRTEDIEIMFFKAVQPQTSRNGGHEDTKTPFYLLLWSQGLVQFEYVVNVLFLVAVFKVMSGIFARSEVLKHLTSCYEMIVCAS